MKITTQKIDEMIAHCDIQIGRFGKSPKLSQGFKKLLDEHLATKAALEELKALRTQNSVLQNGKMKTNSKKIAAEILGGILCDNGMNDRPESHLYKPRTLGKWNDKVAPLVEAVIKANPKTIINWDDFIEGDDEDKCRYKKWRPLAKVLGDFFDAIESEAGK